MFTHLLMTVSSIYQLKRTDFSFFLGTHTGLVCVFTGVRSFAFSTELAPLTKSSNAGLSSPLPSRSISENKEKLAFKPQCTRVAQTTVLPAKSDSDALLCLQSYQGLRIDR